MRLRCLVVAVALALTAPACSSSTTTDNEDGGADGRVADSSEVTEALTLTSVSPKTGSGWGGEVVALKGTGFVEGTKVLFGQIGAADVTLDGETTLEVVTPKLGAGTWDVTVETPAGLLATLEKAFKTTALDLKFVEVPPFSFPDMTKPPSQCAEMADFDGDGHTDVVVLAGGAFVFLAGDGAGNFADDTFPPEPVVVEPPVEHVDVVSQEVVVDVLTVDQGMPADLGPADAAYDVVEPMDIPEPEDIFEVTETQPETRFPQGQYDGRYLVSSDFDLDGDADLFLSTGPGQGHLLLLNWGNGYFVDASADRLPENSDDGAGVALGDINGDGMDDIVVANRNAGGDDPGQTRIWLSSPGTVFAVPPEPLLPAVEEEGGAVALADIDNDGDPDLVTTALLSSDGFNVKLYLLEEGVFEAAPAGMMPSVDSPVSHLVVVDVDGNLSPDLILVSPGKQDMLMINDGEGYFFDFTMPGMPVDKAQGAHIAAGDMNLDGFPDLVIANGQAQNRLYLNDGSGRFMDYTPLFPIHYDDTTWVLLPDVDSDRDLDVLFLNGTAQPNRLYLSVQPEVKQ